MTPKTSKFPYIAAILLSFALLIQQNTINNLNEGIESLNIAVTRPAVVTRIEPTISSFHGMPLPEIPDENVYATYRVSYYMGNKVQGADAQGYVGIGCGTAYSRRELISCSHLFSEDQDYSKYRLDIFNDQGIMINRIPMKVDRISGTLDLSKIIVDQDLPYFTNFESMEDFNALKIKNWVYIIGAAGGVSPFNITWGELSSKQCEYFPELYQTSSPVIGGNSGGGVYDAKTDKLIGVLVRGGGTISLFVPLTTIIKFLK